MNNLNNGKIAVLQKYGYVAIGEFIGIERFKGVKSVKIKVIPEECVDYMMEGFIFCDISEYEHGENVFELNKEGYEDWLEKIKTKTINDRNKFHKWNLENK